MTWTVGDHGFEMTLSQQVPSLIAAHLRPWLEGWLDRHGVVPGRGRLLGDPSGRAEDPRRGRGGPGPARAAMRASREVFAEYGNMSSPTVLFILDRLRREQAARAVRGPGLRSRPGGGGDPISLKQI